MSDWRGLAAALTVLSEEMLRLARAGEWDAVAETMARRQVLIERLFARPVPSALGCRIGDCVRGVLASDAAVVALGRSGLADLDDKLGALARGRTAQRAYAAHQG